MKCLILSFLLCCGYIGFAFAVCKNCNEIVMYAPEGNSYNYSYISIGDIDKFTFDVDAKHDLHIGLFSSPTTDTPWFEILIGGWLNQKSLIRKQFVDVVTSLTPNVVKTNKTNSMWVKFKNNIVSAGFEGEDAMISFRDRELPKINFIGFHNGYGADGNWKVHIPKEKEIENECN